MDQTSFQRVAAPVLPKARVADDIYTFEDAACTLIAEYVIHSYGSRDFAPDIEVIGIQADFGGRDWVTVPMSCLSGRSFLELEELIREEVEVNHRASYEDAGSER